MPPSRASLLEVKALPPLIRLRRKLEATAGVGVADTSVLAVEPEQRCARRACKDTTLAAAAGKGRVGVENRAGLRDRTSRQQERGDDVERVGGDSEQPPLEAMVGLIVDQLVGRKAPADR